MQAPNETEDGSFGHGQTSRRRFLGAVGLVGASVTSGCLGPLSSNSRHPREGGSTTTAGSSPRDVSSERGSSSGRSAPSERSTPSKQGPSSAGKPSSTHSGTFLSGVYNGDDPLELGTLDEWLGHKPAVVTLYVDTLVEESWIETVVETYMTKIWNAGHVPAVVWQPFVSPREQTPENIETRIANGAFDDTIETWATKLGSWVGRESRRPHQRRFYLLPAPEMNGDWSPWSAIDTDGGGAGKTGSPGDYVEMWKRIHMLFSKAPLDETTTQWVWTPNASQVDGVRTERCYPGDDYVDWIGLDGYNYGDINSDSSWRTPEEVFGAMFDRMKKLADKPLALSEVSTTSYVNGAFRPRHKAEWIERLFSFADEEGIKMICWYNFDDTGRWESDWAVFGGAHGTSSVRVAGETYHAYETYRRQIDRPSTRNARTDHPRILTDDEFAGRF